MGLNYAIINSEFNKLNLVYDVDKLLVSSYPDMDWDSDGYIGGYDEDGDPSPGNDYNKEGKLEIAHTDPNYLAILLLGLMIGSWEVILINLHQMAKETK